VSTVSGDTLQALWRIESPKVIATLSRLMGDVGAAEEMAQEAWVRALEEWPRTGVPDNPGAWLTTVARRRALDELRQRRMRVRKAEAIARESEPADASASDAAALREDALDDAASSMGDDLLPLIFTACHPVLPAEARVALTLRVVGGLTTEEIARAFLVPAPTAAQRIVRAKRALAEAKVAYEVPTGEERTTRLGSVLEVIYFIFNEGYAATAGDDWLRPALLEDALRLGRVLAALMPDEPEVNGLVALMELQASRAGARTDAAGRPILLLDQDRQRWDRLLIQRGLAALARAESLAPMRGPYTLQAALAACHARARRAEDTDWRAIATLYLELGRVAPSPVVALNHAVAVSMVDGPAAGLRLVEALASDSRLAGYHLLPSVRGDLLAKLGRGAEAAAAFTQAADLTRNERERELLLERARKALGAEGERDGTRRSA
jgi:RNA polymerase sigma factor (sigma-70 family)